MTLLTKQKHLYGAWIVKFIIMLLALIPASAFAQIDWKVENPFRMFDETASQSDFKIAKGQTAYDFITGRISSNHIYVPPPYKNTLWKNSTFPEGYAFPAHVPVIATINGRADQQCRWTYNGNEIQLPCNEKYHFNGLTQFGTGDRELRVFINNSAEPLREIVSVKDRLVLGLGDSFASGESNPDLPTVVSKRKIKKLAEDHNKNPKTEPSTGRWMKKERNWVEANAEWFDKTCHRSLYSQHVLAGLRLASRNDHETVTLIPLGCSGAEIVDGLLTPQIAPPGGASKVKEAQLNKAVRILCPSSKKYVFESVFLKGKTGSNEMELIKHDMVRCTEKLRQPDVVLLSIGGNDVGFSGVLKWAMLPSGHRNYLGAASVNVANKVVKPVCPDALGDSICHQYKPDANKRVREWLPEYFKLLSYQLFNSGLLTEPNRLYLTAYPNPTLIEDGINYCDADRSQDIGEQARSALLKAFRPTTWEIKIYSKEFRNIDVGLIKPLNQQLRNVANEQGWNFVDTHLNVFKKHGLCADFKRENPSIPIYPHIRRDVSGGWYPKSPDKILAYDNERESWFRNTNDAILFQTDKTDGDINGAFHPDFRGHATYADALYDSIEKNW